MLGEFGFSSAMARPTPCDAKGQTHDIIIRSWMRTICPCWSAPWLHGANVRGSMSFIVTWCGISWYLFQSLFHFCQGALLAKLIKRNLFARAREEAAEMDLEKQHAQDLKATSSLSMWSFAPKHRTLMSSWDVSGPGCWRWNLRSLSSFESTRNTVVAFGHGTFLLLHLYPMPLCLPRLNRSAGLRRWLIFSQCIGPKKVKRNVVGYHCVPLHMFSPTLIYFHWYSSLMSDHTSWIPGWGPAWAAWAAWAVPNNRLYRKTIYIIVFGLLGYTHTYMQYRWRTRMYDHVCKLCVCIYIYKCICICVGM